MDHKSCIRCNNFLRCKDPRKTITFYCDRYSVTKQSLAQEKALLEDFFDAPFRTSTPSLDSGSPIALPGEANAGMFDVKAALEEMMAEKRMVSPDLKIPEGDFLEAPNFYTWCTGEGFLNQKPFAMQAMIATQLFAEYCVAKGSYITSESGIRRIEELCNAMPGMTRYRLNVATLEGIEQTSHSGLTSKSRNCLKISTYRCGRSITVTPEHRVLVFRSGRLEWVQAKDIRTGDYLTAKLGQNLWPKRALPLPHVRVQVESKVDSRAVNEHLTRMPVKTSAKLARFVGYLLSDGTITKYRVGFINTSKKIRDDFVSCGEHLFGIKFVSKAYVPKHGTQKCYTAVHNSVSTCSALSDLGIKHGTCYDKEIPNFILQGTRSEVVEFLRAVFDCDGYLHKRRIGISMSSKHIIDGISLLLDNLGIYHYRESHLTDSASHPHIKRKKNRGPKDIQYRIEIRDVLRFCEEIGTGNDQRTVSCSWNLKHATNSDGKQTSAQHNVKPGSIPGFNVFVARLLAAKTEYHGLSISSAVSGCQRATSVALDDVITGDLFTYCVRYDCLDVYEELLDLQRRNLAYYQVESVVDAGKHPVYDLTVPGSESFMCNGVVVHNCPLCSDMEYMEHNIKVGDSLEKFGRKIALLEHGKCPHCGATKLKLFKKGLLAPYWELALVAGQRSGKSALLGMMGSYLTHRMIKLGRPNEVLGLLKSNVLHGTFVALTFQQAQQTLYEPYYGNILDSPWFQSYNEMLDRVGGQRGEELYKLKDSFVQYRHRRLLVYPAGPDKRVLRGRTRFLAGIDELGWFQHGAEAAKNIKMNAAEVYIALERSLLTVRAKAKSVIKGGFYNVPFGYFINISSPSSVRDKIMELVRKAQGSKVILGLNYPTWKMNPHVPRSALAEEFRKDPETAMRDYGAQPPLTNSPFISSGDKLELCWAKKPQALKLRYHVVRSSDRKTSELYATADEIRQSGKASILALDAGYSGNSFAFALGHRAKNGYPVLSLVGEVMPQPGIRINHSLMYTHLLSELIPLRNVVLIAADRWNSLKVLADAEQDFGIQKRQYSLKYADMQLFKSYLDDMQLMLPRPRQSVEEILKYDHSKYPDCFKQLPVEHMTLQALTVQDTGSQVIKGDGLTDDILRAGMLAFRLLIDEEYEELFGQADAEVSAPMQLSQMVISKLYSGGGMSPTGGGGGSQGGTNPMGIIRSRQ